MSWSATGDPRFWVALAALVVNDHFLKGAGILPGAWTGKISDVAGLVVASLLGTTVLARLGRFARPVAFAAVAVVFASLEVSRTAVAMVESATAAVGVPWRLWPDPTDLLALGVLPFAWRIGPTAGRPFAARAGVVLGAIACVATSVRVPETPRFFVTQAFVANQTGAAIAVRVSWPRGSLDCERIAEVPARVFGPERFEIPLTFQLQPAGTAPLDPVEAATLQPGSGTVPTPLGDCGAALLRGNGLPDTVVFWNGLASREVGAIEPGEVPVPLDGRVDVVLDDAGRPQFVATDDLVLFPLAEHIAPSSCAEPAPVAIGWSDPTGMPFGTQRLVGFTTGPDGCLALDLDDGLDHLRTFVVCAPAEDFPFAPDDLVTISADAARTFLGIESDTASMRLERGASASGEVVPIDGCEGARVGGAYALESEVVVEGVRARAADRVALPPDGDRERTLFVGSAWTFLTSVGRLGAEADVVLVSREMP